ncbi:hypothetical protein PAXRUDRAFT_827059 [Paxillus rubicundulus Ve08.2h10]|uniref:Uncharacterized protein n=1 Tax=Paxillus rubicundulus Ve08.2h10 TaxID=930991 RepID=A0A0D0DDM0_9AGAM|nr:hypothetical protein PAXRUDRAFT_827059 [Paxillus rubicundulus Ve08.2h10]
MPPLPPTQSSVRISDRARMKVRIAFALLVSCVLAATSPSGQRFLCTPDRPCWPNTLEFSQLQAQAS